MKTLIEKVHGGRDLDAGDISYALPLLLSDAVEDKLKLDFLAALHDKGETADEIVGFARLLLDRAIDPQIDQAQLPGPMIDVCGTGGTGLNLFNVSTTIMFILAAGGAVVVKHGNRSVTSICGSADVLEKLGVQIHLTAEEVRECAERLGLAFIFARQFHPAFLILAGIRERLARQKTRTIFNLLGPLLNPARPAQQLIGVFTPRLTNIFADVLRQLGRNRAWVVHGLTNEGTGMDNISISGATTIADVGRTKISSAVLDARWLNVPESPLAEMRGGSAECNAATLTGILSGEVQGAKRDLAVVNAAGGFFVAGLVSEMNEGIALAREQLDSGRALAKLRALQDFVKKSAR